MKKRGPRSGGARLWPVSGEETAGEAWGSGGDQRGDQAASVERDLEVGGGAGKRARRRWRAALLRQGARHTSVMETEVEMVGELHWKTVKLLIHRGVTRLRDEAGALRPMTE